MTALQRMDSVLLNLEAFTKFSDSRRVANSETIGEPPEPNPH